MWTPQPQLRQGLAVAFCGGQEAGNLQWERGRPVSPEERVLLWWGSDSIGFPSLGLVCGNHEDQLPDL